MYSKLKKKIRLEKEIFCRAKEIKKLKKNTTKKLTISEIREIKEFFEKYTKIKNLDWHEYYKSYLEFDKRNIPEDIYFTKIIPSLNNQSLRLAYADKNMYAKNFPKFKMPKTLIRNINGVCVNENYNYIDLEEELYLLKDGEYIIKETLDTSGGRGVSGFKKYLGKYFLFDSKREINILDLIKKFNKNYLIQEKIKQYEKLAKLHKNSLNTIRIVSYRSSEKISILSAVLRIGNNGILVDNPATSGGFTVGINLKTGIVKSIGVEKGSGVVKNIHPYTKEKFSDLKIPNFEELKNLIKEYHLEIPYYFDLVSWDIGINENSEFIVIELNLGAQEINFHQKTNGPLFGDLTEEVLERVFLRKD